MFGEGEPTLVLVPANPIVHSRQWKAQVHYLARHHRVMTLRRPGQRALGRPADPAAYTERAYLAELAAVLDATGSDRVFQEELVFRGALVVWYAIDRAGWHADQTAASQ